jgi:tetratricopeptide (TPR) repeat protein
VTTLNNYAYNISIRENSGIKMLQTALDYASLALDQDPENASFLDTVGWIYYKMEKNELAEYFIIQSLKYNDSNPIIFEHLGDIYVSMNNMMNAISAYENAIEIDSQNEIIQKKIEKIKIND